MNGVVPPLAVLLDTCAVIWLVNGVALSDATIAAVKHAGGADGVYVSTVSAWEIGLLSRPRPNRQELPQFWPDPKTWFADLMAKPGLREAPITAGIAIDASFLPGTFHADPFDRLIVATARHRGLPIVTGDRKILDYGASGYVRVIPC